MNYHSAVFYYGFEETIEEIRNDAEMTVYK